MDEDQDRLRNLLEENERKKNYVKKRREYSIENASKVAAGESLADKLARLGVDSKTGKLNTTTTNIRSPPTNTIKPTLPSNNFKNATNSANTLNAIGSTPVVDTGCADGVLGCIPFGGLRRKRVKKSRKSKKTHKRRNKKTKRNQKRGK